jgi:hypothetical protein
MIHLPIRTSHLMGSGHQRCVNLGANQVMSVGKTSSAGDEPIEELWSRLKRDDARLARVLDRRTVTDARAWGYRILRFLSYVDFTMDSSTHL